MENRRAFLLFSANKNPSIITIPTQIHLLKTGLAVWITKRIVLLHYETAGCEFCTASRNPAFRSDDNSPSTGHLTRKALLCVFAQEKILPFHSNMLFPVCKEKFKSKSGFRLVETEE